MSDDKTDEELAAEWAAELEADEAASGGGDDDMGDDFAAEWVDTTDGWTAPDGKVYWLNDRKLARRIVPEIIKHKENTDGQP